MKRYFEAEWACVGCGKPIEVLVICYQDEEKRVIADEVVALESHECEEGYSVEKGESWDPNLHPGSILPDWNEMEPWL